MCFASQTTLTSTTHDAFVLRCNALEVEIGSGLPEAALAYGPRFDRSAAVRQVRLRGVPFVGAPGMTDEFGLNGCGVLGYEEAEVGGEFLKIGVGRLRRDDGGPYNFLRAYPVVEHYASLSAVEDGRIMVRQRGELGTRWVYELEKTYRVLPRDGFELGYRLTNHGTKPWGFQHYNHHWFSLGGVGPDERHRVRGPFRPAPLPEALGFTEGELFLPRGFPARRRGVYHGEFLCEPRPPDANRFTLRLPGVGEIHCEAGFEPVRFAVYYDPETVSPEFFHQARLEPGETAEWSVRYRLEASH